VPDSNLPERQRRALARDVVIVGIETTMRISELALLEKSQVHFQRGIGYKHGYLAIKNAKTNRPKVIPITSNVAEILKRRIVENPGRYVFKPESQVVNDFGRMIRRAYRNACKRVGIHYGLKTGGAVFHTIRHSTTTYLVNKKLPLSQVMAITGHSKKTTLLIYAHPTADTMEEATELLTMDFGEDEKDKASNG
jgi:integrase